MASILKVDEMQGVTSAGDITITSEGGAATMQLQQGVAKAWINFTGVSTTASRDSFNISSITDAATGQTYPISITSAMANADYAGSYYQMGGSGTARGSFNNHYAGGFGDKATTEFGTFAYGNGVAVDSGVNDVTIQGDLA